MSTVHAPISTEIKIRFPVEMLEGIEHWAAARQIPRSKAIRKLIYRGLARPAGQCDCDSPDACTGNCD
jgi:hypothetical protein